MTRRSERYFVALIGLLFAAGVFYMALPQALSAFRTLDGVRAAADLSKGERPQPEDLRKLVRSRAGALIRGANAVYARELSRAYHALSFSGTTETRRSAVKAAFSASAKELRMRPLNASAWWRLAVMRARIDGRASPKGAGFLWQSVNVQPHAMTLVPIRLRAITDHWFQFTAAQREAMRDQFALAWQMDRQAVLRLAEVSRRRAVIRAGLATRPSLLAAFEAVLAPEK